MKSETNHSIPRNDILSITVVHPIRHDADEALSEKAGLNWSLIDSMLQDGKIAQSEFNGSFLSDTAAACACSVSRIFEQ